MDNIPIYYCYSKPQKDFLIQHGLRFFTKGIHEKTKKNFWMFYGTEYLNQLLKNWKQRRSI